MAPVVNGGSPVYLNQAGVIATPGATDPGGSGVQSASCGAISTSTPGDHTVTCTATDNAGNPTTVIVPYVVQYKVSTFASPVSGSKFKTGQTVPIKIMLTDAAGIRISDATAAALTSACRVSFSASGAQSLAPACMTYSSLAHQFQFNWRLAKTGKGTATIAVTVSYPDTTSATTATQLIIIT